MSLPRRVPWSNKSEFEHVFTLLFASNGEPTAQQQAINRIHTWQSRGCCPYAAEASAALLSVLLRDSANSSLDRLDDELRLSYAMALIRFVNGLVDPAQQGPYARSIATIATQIGLPLWFVELRHAATHEDLPSLDVLRDACRRAMDWLYQRYWLLQMQPSDQSEDDGAQEELLSVKLQMRNLLMNYKTVQKAMMKDASRSTSLEAEIIQLERAIRNAVYDFGLLSSTSMASTSAVTLSDTSEPIQAGLQALADILTNVGFLVPTSKKKRASPTSYKLPEDLVAIWQALLDSLEDLADGFLRILLWRILAILQDNAESEVTALTTSDKREKSYLATLVAWAVHLMDQEDEDGIEEVVRFCFLNPSNHIALILEAVRLQRPALAKGIASLQLVQRGLPVLAAGLVDTQINVLVHTMENRSNSLRENDHFHTMSSTIGEGGQGKSDQLVEPLGENGRSGWKRFNKVLWKPCPFGTLPAGPAMSLQV